MRAAGYVLVGGRSSRMGSDKALLPYGEATLVEHVAAEVLAAAGSVTLVGDRTRYRHLGFDVISDRLAGNGPLGGVAAAVSASPEWALVVACDMPAVTSDLLSRLLKAAEGLAAAPERMQRSVECVVPEIETGPEPLCALYHRRALPLLDSFLDHKFLKMKEVVRSLQAHFVPVSDSRWFRNVNTPEEFQAHE